MATKKKVVKKKKTSATKKKVAKKKVATAAVKKQEEVCCVGCKVEDFISDLKKSAESRDRDLGWRFQDALDDYNLENEEPIAGC